jgi:TetR/AcrR family transcriptional regulator, transcriptional repressor for nem operon
VGRNKQFERDDVLEKAMQLFWLHGYDGVSTQELVDAMGINRKSVYAEFGNKQKLYHAALDKYLCDIIPQRFEALNANDTGLHAIFSLLDRCANAAGRAGPEKGCMLCNAASETAHQDAVARKLVDRYFTVIRSSLAHALNAAKRKGELPEGFETDVWAASLATTFIGMFVMIRSKTDSMAVRTAADLAKLQLTKCR